MSNTIKKVVFTDTLVTCNWDSSTEVFTGSLSKTTSDYQVFYSAYKNTPVYIEFSNGKKSDSAIDKYTNNLIRARINYETNSYLITFTYNTDPSFSCTSSDSSLISAGDTFNLYILEEVNEISKVKLADTTYNLKDTTARESLLTKQDILVSGTNIKTINSESLLGSGNINIGSSFIATIGQTTVSELVDAIAAGMPIVCCVDPSDIQTYFVVDYAEVNSSSGTVRLSLITTVSDHGRVIDYTVSSNSEGATTWTPTLVQDLQNKLVSGTSIKTINNNSLLGSGNIDLESDVFVATYGTTTYTNLKDALDNNKAIIVDMPNNNNSFYITYSTYVTGSDITLYTIFKDGSDLNLTTMTVTTSNSWSVSHDKLQDKLVSGTNIKTINSTSLLGSGDIELNEGKIDKIKVNGTEQTVINKEVNLEVDVVDVSQSNESVTWVDKGAEYDYSASLTNTTNGATFVVAGTTTELVDKTYVDSVAEVDQTFDDTSTKAQSGVAIAGELLTKQDVLTSGTNIKTVNGNSILGSGNLPVVQGEYDAANTKVELEQGTNALSFIQTTDGLSVTANTGSGNDFIDRELVSKSYVSQYQTQAQVEALILDELSRFDKLDYQIVTALPATGAAGVRYLVKHATDDRYEEYIYINGQWYDIGSTDEVNLEDYYTKTEADLLLADKADSADIPTLTSELTNDGDGTNNFVTFGDKATDTAFGVVKLNPTQSVTLDSDGKLQVGGRLGQFEGTTGIFASNDREPRSVGNYSFLITDAKGMNLSTNRAFALVSGLGVTCKSAAAGATEYRVTNNYANRIVCKMAEGGYASINEATSQTTQIIPIVSVTINGSSFTPDSSADSSTDIIIKTQESLNPSSATTGIRLFGTMGSYSSVYTGNGIKGESGGRNLLIGGGVTKATSSNDNCLVGNGIYSTGNGVAAFGRYHIARKNRGFLAGTGHDTTNAPSEGASAVGQYSYMDSNTLFAVGSGTSHTNRGNAFEVRSDGSIVLRSPNGTRYKIAVDNSGNISATAV